MKTTQSRIFTKIDLVLMYTTITCVRRCVVKMEFVQIIGHSRKTLTKPIGL